MVTSVQVVVDALDPHAQARFWAAALHYDVEDTTALIERLDTGGLLTPEQWFSEGGQRWFKDLVGIRDPDGAAPRLLFQRRPDAKVGKNRVHLDLNVGREQRAEEVTRLEGLGARVLYEIDEPGGRHTTMADPEGNEYCVQ